MVMRFFGDRCNDAVDDFLFRFCNLLPAADLLSY
jgi:hypothetical protein